jgi:hypothetical protein
MEMAEAGLVKPIISFYFSAFVGVIKSKIIPIKYYLSYSRMEKGCFWGNLCPVCGFFISVRY